MNFIFRFLPYIIKIGELFWYKETCNVIARTSIIQLNSHVARNVVSIEEVDESHY
jgi:hypothetical protein